jgi:hypothetical protein
LLVRVGSDLRFGEVGLDKARVTEVNFCEIGICQIGLGNVSFGKVGSAEVSSAEVDASEVYATEDDLREFGAAKVDSVDSAGGKILAAPSIQISTPAISIARCSGFAIAERSFCGHSTVEC